MPEQISPLISWNPLTGASTMLPPSRRKPMRTLLLAVILSATAVYASASTLSVGTATAASGQKVNGYLEVPAGSDPGTNIPVVVINGVKPGPTLALVSRSEEHTSELQSRPHL